MRKNLSLPIWSQESRNLSHTLSTAIQSELARWPSRLMARCWRLVLSIRQYGSGRCDGGPAIDFECRRDSQVF
jgi:hypothetical protein